MKYRRIRGIRTPSGWVLVGLGLGLSPAFPTLTEAMLEIDLAYINGALR